MPDGDNATRDLVTEGLRSYVDALAAIRAFKIEIVKGCRTILEDALPALSRSLGITVGPGAISEEVEPSDIETFGEGWAWIGVAVELIRGQFWISIGIYIDENDPTQHRVRAYAGFSTARKEAIKTLFRALGDLRGHSFVMDEEDHMVSSVEPVPEDALDTYPAALKTATKRWLDVASKKPLSSLAKEMGLVKK